MITVYITVGNSYVNFYLECWLDGDYICEGYKFYNERQALNLFRRNHNLKYKHIEVVDCRRYVK